jgi:hypothetical protein
MDFSDALKDIIAALPDGFIDIDLAGCTGTSFAYDETITPEDKARFVAVTLPNTITELADGNPGQLGGLLTPSTPPKSAFSGFISLKSISAPALLKVGSYAFIGCTSLTTVNLPAATDIGERAFESCTSLTTIEFLSAETFGQYAFVSCSNLKTVNLPETKIFASYLFVNCTNLETITLEKAETFGWSTFVGCSSLKTVTFPKAKTFGTYTFYNCTSLETVTFGANPPDVGKLTFSGIGTSKSITVYVPAGSAEAYNNADWQNNFKGGNDNIQLTITEITPAS